MATQSVAVEVQSRGVAEVEALLADSQERIAAMLHNQIQLPKFLYVAMELVRGTPGLVKCAESVEGRVSIVKSILEASELGLLLTKNLGHGYLIPYQNGEMTKRCGYDVSECQFQIGYRGFLELVRTADPEVRMIYSRIVWPADEFLVDEDSHQLSHHPDEAGGTVGMDSNGQVAGFRGCYSKIIYTNGQQDFEWMPLHEIQKIQRSSKARSNDSPWRNWPEEMIKKTPMRRLCKRLKLTPDVLAGVVRDEYRDAGVGEGTAESPRVMIMPRRKGETVAQQPAAATVQTADYSTDTPPNCAKCGKVMNLVPGGVSKNGPAYPPFWGCPDRCRMKNPATGRDKNTGVNAQEWHATLASKQAETAKEEDPERSAIQTETAGA